MRRRGMLGGLLRRYHITGNMTQAKHLMRLKHADLIQHITPGETNVIKLTNDEVYIKMGNHLIIKVYPAYHTEIMDAVLVVDYQLIIKHPSQYKHPFKEQVTLACVEIGRAHV